MGSVIIIIIIKLSIFKFTYY